MRFLKPKSWQHLLQYLSLTLHLFSSLAYSRNNFSTLLSVGSYNGSITVLRLSNTSNKWHLSALSVTHAAAPSPSWQMLDPANSSVLYSVNEGNPGGVFSFHLDRKSGSLKKKIGRAHV